MIFHNIYKIVGKFVLLSGMLRLTPETQESIAS